MYWSRIVWSALAANLALSVYGQQSGWQENQANATMCTWQALRAAQVKDTVYMDGGYLWWVPGMADGSFGPPTQDNNPLGLIYTLNFSTPFNSSTNISSILGTISKAPNGGAANNFAPNYYDGAMLANNDEFFLYGGLLLRTDAYSSPDADEVLAYQISQYGTEKGAFQPGFVNGKLPDDMTRYVTYGGAASAPSENKAWYFGGYRSLSWGPIYYPTANDSINPINVSDTLITLNLGEQQRETWTNVTLPEGTPSRANPSLVWVPVGAEGILVALGGVTYPNYNNPRMQSQNEAQSDHDSPGFMSNIDIYDIANDKWYQQPTIGAPPALTLGCAVVVPAQDFSSYNIYHYGGYDGVNPGSDFNDDVWILSLPSFMWMKVSSGKAEHARAGHQCVMPYPDQMVTIGGYTTLDGQSLKCLDGGILQVFNLTDGHWMEAYDPDSWNEYGVPEMIHLMIGGDYSGGATMTTPTPTGWATPELASVFATTYAASKISNNYPYGSQGPGNNTRGAYSSNGGGGTPSWVPPVLGVVLGLIFVTAVVVGILLFRRRKFLKRNGGSENSSDENRHRVISWVAGQSNAKTPTLSTEDPSSFGGDTESRSIVPIYHQGHSHKPSQPEMRMAQRYEMPNTQLVELGDTPPRAELGDTARTPIDIINKHTHHGTHTNSPPFFPTPTNTSSFFADSLSHDHASSISSSQIQPQPPQSQQRPDSPPLGNSNPGQSVDAALSKAAAADNQPLRCTIVSGMSGISERNATHSRQLSNTTVSSEAGTAGAGVTPSGTPPPSQRVFHHAPVSPPLPVSPPSVGALDEREASGYMDGHDYLQAQGQSRSNALGTSTSSPLRTSVFRESTNDLEDDNR
ncbi:hypothetical protein F5X99DRAFT_424377 [Biscogniauxia marginata]|nr:hypothetical protein F5X99DRAFT_424377 [Biscogniauxia marginata]